MWGLASDGCAIDIVIIMKFDITWKLFWGFQCAESLSWCEPVFAFSLSDLLVHVLAKLGLCQRPGSNTEIFRAKVFLSAIFSDVVFLRFRFHPQKISHALKIEGAPSRFAFKIVEPSRTAKNQWETCEKKSGKPAQSDLSDILTAASFTAPKTRIFSVHESAWKPLDIQVLYSNGIAKLVLWTDRFSVFTRLLFLFTWTLHRSQHLSKLEKGGGQPQLPTPTLDLKVANSYWKNRIYFEIFRFEFRSTSWEVQLGWSPRDGHVSRHDKHAIGIYIPMKTDFGQPRLGGKCDPCTPCDCCTCEVLGVASHGHHNLGGFSEQRKMVQHLLRCLHRLGTKHDCWPEFSKDLAEDLWFLGSCIRATKSLLFFWLCWKCMPGARQHFVIICHVGHLIGVMGCCRICMDFFCSVALQPLRFCRPSCWSCPRQIQQRFFATSRWSVCIELCRNWWTIALMLAVPQPSSKSWTPFKSVTDVVSLAVCLCLRELQACSILGSKECQRSDWKSHKLQCQRFLQLKNSARGFARKF